MPMIRKGFMPLIKSVCPEPADGFSLVEVMTAVFILAFGLLAAARLLTMTMGLDMLARSKSAAAMAAQNELERLADIYRRNPSAGELTIGTHQAVELSQVRNPLSQNVINMYKITWLVGGLADPRPGITLPGRIISVNATPMLTENEENTRPFLNKTVTINAVIAAEP
jgi:prepilin-type N-terminal cleavage/methylation domain-containing protein